MSYQSFVSVSAGNDALILPAKALADALKLPLLPLDKNRWQLVVTHHRLELRAADLGGAVFINFTSGKNAHRIRFNNNRQQPLAKAIGLQKNAAPTVIDATAGFARDAFVLASLGCKVTLVERNPLILALLDDALKRAQDNVAILSVINRMALIKGDAAHYLSNLTPQKAPDVVYLDPMYPARTKSALVKKEMRLLHNIIGEDSDSAALFAIAKKTARKRVVVKRPQSAPFISEEPPAGSTNSKNTRYDIYPATTKSVGFK